MKWGIGKRNIERIGEKELRKKELRKKELRKKERPESAEAVSLWRPPS